MYVQNLDHLKKEEKRNPTRSDLFFINIKLPEEDELEILGITVDRKLTWTKHIFNITARAGQKLGALRKVANKLNIAGRATLYKVQIYSGMEYASLCWMSASTTTLNFSTPSTVTLSIEDHWCERTAGMSASKHPDITS